MRFLLLLAIAGPSFAQFNSSGSPGAVVVGASPSGQTCTTATAQAKIYSGTIYTCQAGTYAAVSGGGGGTGNVSASGTPTAIQSAQWTDATHVKGVSQGVFNVRTMYGAVPDGSTDNATAIASVFIASNAMTTGTPTVYFDCDTSSTTCQYNYGGSGTSPINPLIPTNIQCATGVTLNYTGTAHAVDIGPSNLTQPNTDRYTVQGCRWTGGASYTAGLYFNNYIVNSAVSDNEFTNFGNQTAYSIVYTAGDWTPTVSRNYWRDTDGVSRNMLDAHSSGAIDLLFHGNKTECETVTVSACSIVTEGVGLWIGTGWIYDNELKYHRPLIRLSSNIQTNGFHIRGNMLEGNTGETGPFMTYGDPGTAGNIHITNVLFEDNTIYWPAASTVSYVGPETASSSQFYLDKIDLLNNIFRSTPTGSGAVWVKTNSGAGKGLVSNNFGVGVAITRSTTPAIFDTNTVIQQSYFGTPTSAFPGNLNNAVAAFTSAGEYLTQGSLHHIATPLLCVSSSVSGTAQTCDTTPKFDITGTAVSPTAGDSIVYKTATTNTGDMTIAINGTTAKSVKKLAGASALAAGDLKLGVYYVLTYDGTNWEMPSYATAVPTSCTGLPSGALFNSSGTASFCP